MSANELIAKKKASKEQVELINILIQECHDAIEKIMTKHKRRFKDPQIRVPDLLMNAVITTACTLHLTFTDEKHWDTAKETMIESVIYHMDRALQCAKETAN